MTTIIVCDWIPPAFGAVGQYMDQRARKLAAGGEQAVLIGLGETAGSETGENLTIVRLAAPKLPKTASLFRRALWALNNNRRLIAETNRHLANIPEGEGEIVVTGSPPFLSYLMILINRLWWRRTLIYRITDFYPETVFAAGHFKWLKWIEAIFHGLRRGADRIEALGQDQKRRLMEGGISEDVIDVVRDASPIADWNSGKAAKRPFPKDKVILLYSGNLGVAHDLPTFCEAYERHVRQGSDRIRLWMNGQGARLGELKDFCEARDLPLHLTPPAALEDLPGVLKTGDAQLVLQRDEFWGFVLPSKIYACLELDRPIFYVGPEESDVHLLSSQRGGAYFHVKPGDVEGCAAALEALADQVAGSNKSR